MVPTFPYARLSAGCCHNMTEPREECGRLGSISPVSFNINGPLVAICLWGI